jgi:hypothetical protein
MSDQDISNAPQVQTDPGPQPSVLGQTVAPQTPTLNESGDQNNSFPAPPSGGSRLLAILGAVARVGETALSGIPDRGRPSFVTGLGEGARAQVGAQQYQQQIKFRSFDDQVRMAELHNQDQKMQNDNQAQIDAHTKAEIDNRALANEYGINYDSIANHGPTVMDHLTAQSANGGASVPPGTHISADGDNIYMPSDPDSQKTKDGQKQMYSALAPALGLPSLPPGASFVPPKLINMLTNKVHGFTLDGKPPNHDDLPGLIGATQAQRDSMAKNGASDAQLKTLDNMIGIYQANLDSLDKHAAGVAQQTAQAKKAGEFAAENTPEAVKVAASKAAATKQAELDVTNSPANQDAAAQGAAKKAAAEEQAKGSENLVVAYDPSYGNSDGTKGGNVVITKGDAQAKGLQHYKADGNTISSTIGSFNDVQGKVDKLAAVVTDPNRMSQVQPGNAAAILAHDHGLDLGAGAAGVHAGIDTSRINEKVYAAAVNSANQATLDYVTAMVNAHEAITQLPRLQTFGKSSRMTGAQMDAAVNLLPHPGDGRMAQQKMIALQGQLDSLRKAMPHMPGNELNPTWLEQKPQLKQPTQQQAAPPMSLGSKLGHLVVGDLSVLGK